MTPRQRSVLRAVIVSAATALAATASVAPATAEPFTIGMACEDAHLAYANWIEQSN